MHVDNWMHFEKILDILTFQISKTSRHKCTESHPEFQNLKVLPDQNLWFYGILREVMNSSLTFEYNMEMSYQWLSGRLQ